MVSSALDKSRNKPPDEAIFNVFANCVTKQGGGEFSGTFFTKSILTITKEGCLSQDNHTFACVQLSPKFRQNREYRDWSVVFNKFCIS